MPADQKLVIHFQDGRVVKGYSHDFFPNKDRFHFILLGQPSGQKPIEIALSQLKAIFFVTDFVGDKGYQELKDFSGVEKSSYGKKIIVRFKDGE